MGELAFAREQRLKEIQMWTIIREFSIYAIFIILISLITFSNRGENNFYQVKHLRSYFFNTRQTENDYKQVRYFNYSSFTQGGIRVFRFQQSLIIGNG